jgi:hypothetical protein
MLNKINLDSRAYPSPLQLCRHAGCISLYFSCADMQGVSLFTSAVQTCRVYLSLLQLCGHAGCISLYFSCAHMQGVSLCRRAGCITGTVPVPVAA